MKLFKKLFVFLLVLPLAFSFVGCGKDDDGTENNTPSQEQPSTPTDTSNVFFVSYDYDLPEGYEYLLNNPARTSGNVGDNLICLNVNGAGLADYFEGWYKSTDEDKTVISTITGEKGEQITLKGLWNKEKLDKYYYSAELGFEIDSSDGNVATVSSWTGTGDKVIIPEIYKVESTEYKVNAIGDSVFENSGIKTILNHAKDYSIGERAFKGTDLESFDFSSVVSIGSNAFENCTGFTSIDIDENVESLGDNVFAGCSNITEVKTASLFDEMNRNLTFIGYLGDIRASVTKVVLTGDAIEKIPSQYFENWTKLETIELCESLDSFGNYCFDGCEKLENIVGLENLNPELFTKYSINETKFFKGLTEPLVMQNVLVLAPAIVDETLVIKEGVNKIQKNAFAQNSSLKEVTIPSTVVSIGENAFSGCSNLQKVTFVENGNLAVLDAYVFAYCNKLADVNITNLKVLKTISNNVFDSVAISNFVIPATVETISATAFYNAAVASFEIQGTSLNFVTQDGVLYEVEGEEKTLLAYPKYKTGDMFVLPEDVANVSSFAFVNNMYLQWIYVAQEELNFDSIYVFDGAMYDISLIAENSTIVSPSYLNRVYYLVDENVTYFVDANGVNLDVSSNFELIEGSYDYFFIMEIPGEPVTYRYFIFSVDVQGSDDDVVISVNDETVVEMTEYFA